MHPPISVNSHSGVGGGACTGTVNFKIRTTTAGVPDDSPAGELGNKSMDCSDFGAGTPAWEQITFDSPVNLTAGTIYAIVTYMTTGSTNGLIWREDSTNSGYNQSGFEDTITPLTGNTFLAPNVGEDFMFRMYKTDAIASTPAASSWDYAATSTDAIVLLPLGFGFLFFFIAGFWIMVIYKT